MFHQRINRFFRLFGSRIVHVPKKNIPCKVIGDFDRESIAYPAPQRCAFMSSCHVASVDFLWIRKAVGIIQGLFFCRNHVQAIYRRFQLNKGKILNYEIFAFEIIWISSKFETLVERKCWAHVQLPIVINVFCHFPSLRVSW